MLKIRLLTLVDRPAGRDRLMLSRTGSACGRLSAAGAPHGTIPGCAQSASCLSDFTVAEVAATLQTLFGREMRGPAGGAEQAGAE